MFEAIHATFAKNHTFTKHTMYAPSSLTRYAHQETRAYFGGVYFFFGFSGVCGKGVGAL